MGLFNFLTQEIAIDLGTANTLIIWNDKVVVDEPSIVAKDIQTGKVVAIGRKAQQMHGKTHKLIETVRPLKDGVIADFQSAEQMIKGMIKMINPGRSLFNPTLRMVICIPSGITEVEKRAVQDSAEHAGAKEVYLIHEPMAAAIGIGIDVEEPMGNMIIDIGGGTSEILKEKIIKEKQKGKLILITSHLLSELDDLITEIIFMQEGKVHFHKKVAVLKKETQEEKISKAIAKILRQKEHEQNS